MVVADAIFETRGRSGRLDAANQAFLDEHAERVVHGLKRNRANLGAHGVGDGVGRHVRRARDGPQDCQPLRGDMNAPLAKERGRVGGHRG